MDGTWPLLLYFGVASTIAAGAIRLGAGLTRRDAAVLIVVPLAFVGPALATGRTLFPVDRGYRVQPLDAHRELLGDRPSSAAIFHDPFALIAPWRAAVRQSFAKGEWPLWNPWCRAGEPLAPLAQSAPYAPVNLLALLVPLEDEAALVGGLNLAIAGLGGFLAIVGFRLSRRAALVGAVAWTTSGFLLFWNPWPVTPTVAFFPWILFAGRRLAREPSRAHAAFLAAMLTLILLTGHSESVAHAVLMAAACTAFSLPWRRPRAMLQPIALAAVAGIVAAALAAFFLLPHLEAIDQSMELVLRRSAADKAFHARPYGESAALLRAEIVPHAWGIANDEVGRHPIYRYALYAPGRAFSGGLILALGMAGIIGIPASPGPRRRVALAGGALFLFGILAGIGFRPLHRLLARLPVFDLALNDRLAFVGAFGLALLAAAAVDAWDSDEPRRSWIPRISAATSIALALATVGFWPEAAALGLDGPTFAARSGWLVLPALAGAALLAFARRREAAILLLLTVHLAERRAETGYLHVPQERRAFFPRVPPLDAIPDTEEPQRVLALDVALPPNTSTHYSFEDPRGDNAMTLRRFAQLRVDRNDPGAPSWTFTRFNRADDPILDLFNVRYLLVPRPKHAPPWCRRIAAGKTLVLYENRRALPRAFLPRRIVLGSDPAALMARTAANPDFRRLATIEPIGWVVPTKEKPNARGRVDTRKSGFGFVIDADLGRSGWIVVSETHWSGWRATVAGKELPLAYADHAFVGIHAPAGRSRIDLRYRPRSFDGGLWISGGTVLLLFLGYTWSAGTAAKSARARRLA